MIFILTAQLCWMISVWRIDLALHP